MNLNFQTKMPPEDKIKNERHFNHYVEPQDNSYKISYSKFSEFSEKQPATWIDWLVDTIFVLFLLGIVATPFAIAYFLNWPVFK